MTGIDWNDFGSHQRCGVAEALDAAGIDTASPDAGTAADAALAAVELDAALIAQGLGLDPENVPAMVADRVIATLCERGVGEDAGLFRFTFYYRGQRYRLLTDAAGKPAGPG